MKSGLLAAGLVVLLASAALPRVVQEMPDFEVYWRAGQRALAGEPLYRPEDGHYQNKYLPAFALAATPLALMPLAAAKVVWFYIAVGSILALIAMSLVLLPARHQPAAALSGLTFLAMLKFYAREVNLGQGNALMGALVLLAFWCFERRRDRAGAAWLALSVIAKPYTIAFVPYLLLKGRTGALGVLTVLFAVVLLAPAVVYGVAGNAALVEAWARTTAGSTGPNLLNQDNVSIWAMYARWIAPGPAATGLALATVAALGASFLAVIWRGRTASAPDFLEVAMLLLLLPLVSPQGWDYGLLLGTPAVMLLFNELPTLPVAVRIASGGAVAAMSLTIYDVVGPRAYAAFMASSALTVCAIGLFLSLAYLRARRIA